MGNRAPSYPLFSERRSALAVNARIAPDVSPRLREIVTAVVEHLHAAVKQIEPTHEEWLAAIRFLTETGHMCDEWRQEFILLSDVLGVSMLVDAINHRRPGSATENTILGPFFVAGTPVLEHGANLCLDGKGEPLLVRARVVDTSGQPVANAVVDVWQANDDGFYDVQQTGIQPRGNLRGKFVTDAGGAFWFRSIKPRHYPIPNDGPVGKLLASLGRSPNRAAHIHFIIDAAGHEPLITHVFAPDCPYLAEDAVFGVKKSLIGTFERVADAASAAEFGMVSPYWLTEPTFVLQSDGR
ncbi:intradiol ring-cleavage dioxygenase [Chromobacterium vaccinii]|uniref:intradiol ring-cleavage dioxygenase n=1 Tax=Chromobacterium vaccinii TaxID=1108595 RepID=UPI003C77200F